MDLENQLEVTYPIPFAFSNMISIKSESSIVDKLVCYHCGQPCNNENFIFNDKTFCCYGCQTVYQILNENDLCEYYNFETNPGIRKETDEDDDLAYLNADSIRKKLLDFELAGLARVTFYIPAIHCISCVWLLENLQKLDRAILKSEVNFVKKTVQIDYKPDDIQLSKVAQLLSITGYKPLINLEGKKSVDKGKGNDLILQLAIAGFCFGNIMMLSFPEYLGIDSGDTDLRSLFSYLNLGLILPVLIFSAKDYFFAAWKSFAQRQINIDVPIAVGLLVLFVRSAHDIITGAGPGYLDSLAGLVFFLLIGRWFQNKTYESLAFDRDYKSYFPLAVYRKDRDDWNPIGVYDLRQGDQIRIRNKEIIPADSFLISPQAYVDYSFVTGESKPVGIKAGDFVYAGGRLVGQPVVLTVNKETSQSHLTSLWNKDVFEKPESKSYKSLIDKVARVFTWTVLILALATGLFWFFHDKSQMWLVVTAVLMVACPCALALAAPFTYGTMLRVFGTHGLYLKNADVVENMAGINSIVFDKTGTITQGATDIDWQGNLAMEELTMIKTLTGSSTHPLSILITKSIPGRLSEQSFSFEEIPGQGIIGKFDETEIRLGSAQFVEGGQTNAKLNSRVFVSIDGEVRGYFSIGTSLRTGVKELASKLGERIKALLSGDGVGEKEKMKTVFAESTELIFNLSPHDKLTYISALQEQGEKVMMLGDGLNDSGALKQSNVGIAVADDTSVFTPSCDGILRGDKLAYLDRFLSLSHAAVVILKISLAISFLYNIVGLGFAVTGHLTPLVAALLMPLSSISIVVFTTFSVNLVAKKTL